MFPKIRLCLCEVRDAASHLTDCVLTDPAYLEALPSRCAVES